MDDISLLKHLDSDMLLDTCSEVNGPKYVNKLILYYYC